MGLEREMQPPVTTESPLRAVLRERHGKDWIEWDSRSVTDDEILYLSGDTVVLRRPRCPAINAKGKRAGERCMHSVGDGYTTCRTHSER